MSTGGEDAPPHSSEVNRLPIRNFRIRPPESLPSRHVPRPPRSSFTSPGRGSRPRLRARPAARLHRVADAATAGLTADTGLTAATGLDSLTGLTALGRTLEGLSAANVTTVTLPVLPAPSDPDRVVPDEPEAGDLWESLGRA